MNRYSIISAFVLLYVAVVSCNSAPEKYRPQIHFTPKSGWMNDPNGMVYHEGVYHLFFQHYPDSTVWGPMHWGHATSTDLVHWEEQSIKLFPDSLGWIFSGSAVYDEQNSSGLGKDGKGPLVAIFTHHSSENEKAQGKDFQYQSLAFSNDAGVTWIKYEGNPVLRKPEGTDFRDPKVMWYSSRSKWIMTLAVKDHIEFYSSPDLKNWTYESSFGAEAGAHGGVWECPDLIPFKKEGKEHWVLLVNINPGAPNGGSGTQYFVGSFDGQHFTASHTDTRWMDYGTDNYAGITWSNTGDRKLLIGWMSNWMYANLVPTKNWRSATTLVRELDLQQVGAELYLKSNLPKELGVIAETSIEQAERISLPIKIEMGTVPVGQMEWSFSNKEGEVLKLGYDKASNRYFIDRSNAGEAGFHTDFAKIQYAPRIATADSMNLTVVLDHSSVELFADDGLTVMTAIVFPTSDYSIAERK
ncbi:glycoside hydrolase family 32 protein [Flavihumibacter sp. UBA7668]|uniref:glycoside hydrolase family 32 protein n=1 Tax=Flavihumibacter sp. UBA7668 TaxID=1946542 RepID=UPI0025C4A636|nr:glycoside hydrolase family 32 protein [Flavihumibacter sp. UBA7668]